MPRSLFAVALGVVALLMVGCSGVSGATNAAGATGGSANVVKVKMTEMRFEPAVITVKAGTPVTITVENVGRVNHDFTVRGLDTPVRIAAGPGQSASATFTPDKPGTYETYCSVPGHEAAGMKGQLVVD